MFLFSVFLLSKASSFHQLEELPSVELLTLCLAWGVSASQHPAEIGTTVLPALQRGITRSAEAEVLREGSLG